MKLSYHARYNLLLKKFSAKDIFSMIVSFAKKIGNPYPIAKKGRKPKILPYEYAAYMTYMILIKGSPFREMEFESQIYTEKHIDHSTFVVNFEKIPIEYYYSLIEEAGAYLDRLLEYSSQYAIDSTAITSPLKFKTEIKGISVVEKIEFRSHIIASIHPLEQCVCIRKALATTKFIADCEGAKIMLEQGDITRINLNADRGYDNERVYKACYENNIKPNIRPRDYRFEYDSYRSQGINEYDDSARKKNRGIIETVFGGITNAGLMTTRLKKQAKILSYCAIIMLRHNILSIARQKSCSLFELLTKLGEAPSGECQ